MVTAARLGNITPAVALPVWGEIDLIAQQPALREPQLLETPLAFVEVKTRCRRNWDANGLLAITSQKQAKLEKAAQLFLAERPDLADLPCRFDVALVSYQPLPQKRYQCDEINNCAGVYPSPQPIALGHPVLIAGYQLTLTDYIQSAFI